MPTTAAQQLETFLAKYSPTIVARAKAVLKKMRARFPTAIELVYDNYNALVVGFSPTERPSEAIFSIVLYPEWVTLVFLQGKGLPDPTRMLQGSGNVVRHIRLPTPDALDDPAVEALLQAAATRAKIPFDPRGKRLLIIRSVSAAQRPRRPAEKVSEVSTRRKST